METRHVSRRLEMRCGLRLGAILFGVILMGGHGSSQVAIDMTPNGVFALNGKLLFPIGFTEGSPVDCLTPDGRDAYLAPAANGDVFNRCRAANWGPAAEAALDYALDRAAQSGLLCGVYIPDLSTFAASDTAKAMELVRVVNKYK